MNANTWRLALGLWTLGIWGSRVRNILADNELTGNEQVLALGVAGGFVVLAVLMLASLRVLPRSHTPILVTLVLAGILRWTIRGPLILVSDEWSVGFKLIHTVLWLTTVALSVAAWRERDTI
jgi:hypothetical protein